MKVIIRGQFVTVTGWKTRSAMKRFWFLSISCRTGFSITSMRHLSREKYINHFAKLRFLKWEVLKVVSRADHGQLRVLQHATTRGHHPPIRLPLTIPRLIDPYVIMRRATHAHRHALPLLRVSWIVSPLRPSHVFSFINFLGIFVLPSQFCFCKGIIY